MSILWLIHGQSTINSLEIHRKFKIYSKKAFLLEPNYYKLCLSSKNEFFNHLQRGPSRTRNSVASWNPYLKQVPYAQGGLTPSLPPLDGM